MIETWVLASLRNRKFFSFEELNITIRDKMKEYNERPFQKRKGSRLSAFEEEEKDFLMPLPAAPYVSAVWSKATIQLDYLINIGNVKYSVPHDLRLSPMADVFEQQCQCDDYTDFPLRIGSACLWTVSGKA